MKQQTAKLFVQLSILSPKLQKQLKTLTGRRGIAGDSGDLTRSMYGFKEVHWRKMSDWSIRDHVT